MDKVGVFLFISKFWKLKDDIYLCFNDRFHFSYSWTNFSSHSNSNQNNNNFLSNLIIKVIKKSLNLSLTTFLSHLFLLVIQILIYDSFYREWKWSH